MKKFFLGVLIIYAVYAVLISSYLVLVETPLPAQYIGTEADPQMFMSEEQLVLSSELSKWRNVIYFIHTPFEWMIYLFVLLFGLSQLFARWSEKVVKYHLFQTGLYVILLSCVSFILSYPFKYLSYSISKQYGISIQTFHSWMKDQFISFWVGAILLIIVVHVIWFLINKSPKRWWFYTWLLSIPFTLFLMFLQPVVIDPLYNDFYPIQDKELEIAVLQMAEQADIPADRVYEVKMSDKTNALNAYVNGIGKNLRIVLWDTTLERLTQDEVLFIMAHEMGHYDLHHLRQLLLGTIALSFIGLFIVGKLYHVTIRKYGNKMNLKHHDLAAIPIILLILSLLSFAASPMSNMVSRAYEYQADRYAIELTNDIESAVSTFQRLSSEGLSDVNPPAIVKFFRYTHPPMVERITQLRKYYEEIN
ncbi:M48 family peptidase [Anaerobacillus alkaliphilus]|uniref:M48 family peptidase n=1 Tax=Anaerobacillus alkaliphilus TaxID=1548597 RepID=A0A4Q0VQS5_9BACI|nr:M48 family metallopeptidase [Anaerobacillus alkaliphilus]RXI98335.1 M48 family peptidase [Anaerobacillus alkaliphilus]